MKTSFNIFVQPFFYVILTVTLTLTLGVNLDGSPGSYIKYTPWEPCLNGSFSLEFKTNDSQSLLLYLNRGKYSYYELKLNKGIAKLRVNLGEGMIMIRLGNSLDNGDWHSLEVSQDGARTSLTIDGVTKSKYLPEPVLPHGPSGNETFMYVGGLPEEYASLKLTLLGLPSVIFEPKFRGSIRNFFYRNCGGEPIRPTPLESSGILTIESDRCERESPCLNGGRCLMTDEGFYCDCSHTEYKGERCDLQKVPSDATFLGTSYLTYNLSSKGDDMVSNQDQITLDFRTKQPSSLLFYTGNSKDYMTVGLLDGRVFLSVNLGSGTYVARTEQPPDVRFDDNRWHQLVIRREAQEVSMKVDGMYHKSGTTTGKFSLLSSNLIHVAGSPYPQSLPGSRVRTNFKGCLRKVRYQADSITLDLTEMARGKHLLLDVIGDVIFDKCQELVESQPVTFTTPESYLTIPTWNRSSEKGSLAFQFRTVEQAGLMMYSNGDRDSRDFFALELMDGHLYLVLNMGSGIIRVKASPLPVTDGHPRDVYFQFVKNRGYISIDGEKEMFVSSHVSDRFNLHGQLYVGGLDPSINSTSVPQELWAAVLKKFYVGCIQDLVLNGDSVNLVAAASMQNRSGVVDYCRRMDPHCASHPCNHRGRCVEGWNRYTCDCRATGFIGEVCQDATVTLRFDGTQFVKVPMAHVSITQAEDISLRFRTMHPNGLLFMANGHGTNGMELYLDNGALYLRIDVGSGPKVLSAGHTLNDDRWHTVFIKRRVQEVELSIDEDRPVVDQLPGSSFSLATSLLFVGLVNPSISDIQADLPGQAKALDLYSVEAGHMVQGDSAMSHSSIHSGFIGSMQALIFNNKDVFQDAKSGGHEDIEITAKFSNDEYVVRDPVTFKSVDAYAVLDRLRAHEEFTISFQLKTTESDGLIMYNGGTEHDFFAMELFQGIVYYIYNMGAGPQRVKANVIQPINDNKWHEVSLLRLDTYKQLLRIDDNTPTIDDLTGVRNNRFDLDGKLYIGGVEKTMYPSLPKLIHSRHGFVGCLGSLDLNGYMPVLLREANPVHESVGDGCRGPMTKCVNDSCANRGRCVQQWTSYKCDCDMTSYSGPMCKDESVTYKFGNGPGLITFEYPVGQELTTNFDSLAFGFKTIQSDAVLVRMDSRVYGDYIQIELADGNVYVQYNMGTIDIPLSVYIGPLNDNRYHVVRFTRAGPNATLQVDNERPQTKKPTGKEAHSFNDQAFVSIGGKKLANGTITEHFRGLISGLVLNGIRIFELAKEGDPRITFEGDVTLNKKMHSPRLPIDTDDEDIVEMQSTQGHTTPSDAMSTDESIVKAGSGADCNYGPGDIVDCTSTDPDDDSFFKGVSHVVSTPTTTTTKSEPSKCTGANCDENSSRLQQPPEGSASTVDPRWPVGVGDNSGDDDGYGTGEDAENGENVGAEVLDEETVTVEGEKVGGNKDKEEESGINLGLILGITGSVLVAVIVLCIALCKLRGRDEGTYKVDETQNFSALQSKKSQGNGVMAIGGESSSGKRGKKKDVKEWYV